MPLTISMRSLASHTDFNASIEVDLPFANIESPSGDPPKGLRERHHFATAL